MATLSPDTRKYRTMTDAQEQLYIAFVGRHHDMIDTVCRQYSGGDGYHYNAIQQAVLERLWTKWHRFNTSSLHHPDKERPWAYRVAVNAAISYHRLHLSRSTMPLSSKQADSLLPASEISTDEELDHLLAALQPDERRLITLSLQGFSYAEIAQIEEKSDTAIRTRICRIFRKMKKTAKSN